MSLQEIKDEISQMSMLKHLTQEEMYSILNESGFPEYIYRMCNNLEQEQ